MTRMNKFFGLLVAFALAAFALPADAQNQQKRQYTLNITNPASRTVNAGTQSVPTTLAVANVSPDGISTIRSFKVYIPANSGITIRQGAQVQPPFAGSVNVAADGLSVTVDAIQPPVKPFDPTVGTLYLNLQVDVQCSFNSVVWSANVYTGTPQSGQQFVLQPGYPSANYTLSRGAACSVSLTTGVSPTAAATVQPIPASVSCNNVTYGSTTATCTETTPSYGYRFNNWTSNNTCTGTGASCNLPNPLLVGPYTVTANFTAYTITPTTTGSGTGSISCTDFDPTTGNRVCTASASTAAATLSRFNGWGGACSSYTTNPSCTLSMNGDKAISADFVRTFTVTTSSTAGGSVNCPSTVDSGSSGTCTATASSGYFLSSFSTNCSRIGTTNQCTVSPTADTAVTATFAAAVGTVDCSTNNYASNNGKVDPDLTYVNLDPSTGAGQGDYGIRRGPNYDDLSGNNCVLVGVQLTKTGNTAHFIYDKTSGQKGSFKYTIVWDEQDVDQSGPAKYWTNNRPMVAWVTTDYPALTGDPVFVPALACVDDDLSLGTTLMPVLPAVEPFIGTAGSASDPANAWAAEYTANGTRTAKMCVAQHGWISNLTVGGKIQVIYFDKFVDQADGYSTPK